MAAKARTGAAKKTPAEDKKKTLKNPPKETKAKATKPEKAATKAQIAPTPTMSGFPSVRKGDQGGYVTVVQTNLKNRGYDIGKEGVDGKFGEKTLNAVKAFQKDAGMTVPNGVVGPKTWELLQKSTVVKIRAAEPVKETPAAKQEPAKSGVRVLIEGLTRYQAELLVMLLSGHTECRIL